MAYKTSVLFKKAMKAIEENELFFIEDIVAFLPCSKDTFYNHFSVDSDDYKTMFEALERNRVKVKTGLRTNWKTAGAPALQLALYKLIATPEEHKSLQMNYQDVTSNGKTILPKIEWEDGDTSEL